MKLANTGHLLDIAMWGIGVHAGGAGAGGWQGIGDTTLFVRKGAAWLLAGNGASGRK